MLTKNGKTNFLFIAIALFVGVAAVGCILYQEKLLGEGLAGWDYPSAKVIHRPTAADQNFLSLVNDCFIPVAALYGYTLRVTSDFRSLDEQQQLYEQGRNVNGHIVTWAPIGMSIHNFGYAVDVVDRWEGYDINWKRLGRIGAYCGLTQVDDPHFEYRGGLTTEQFMAGVVPEPMELPCPVMAERAKDGTPLGLKDLADCGAPVF